MTKQSKPSTGNGPRAIAVIAIIFALTGFSASISVYSDYTGPSQIPMIVGAAMIAILEIIAGMLTLRRNPLGPRMFLIYGVAALIFVFVDAAGLWIELSSRAVTDGDQPHGNRGDDMLHAVGGLLKFFLYHVVWRVGAFAWPIVAMVLAGRWRPKAGFFGEPPAEQLALADAPLQPSM